MLLNEFYLMKSKLTFLLSLTFLFLFGGSVYGKEDCGSRNNPSNYPNPIMCSEHIAMMKSFVDNLENGNIDKIVESINYPLSFWKSGKEIARIEDSYQFKKFYEYIFPKKNIKEIATKFSNDKDYFWKNGSMMFGGGAIWFDLENGKVVTINNYDQESIDNLSDYMR